jgi:hypothetical protein
MEMPPDAGRVERWQLRRLALNLRQQIVGARVRPSLPLGRKRCEEAHGKLLDAHGLEEVLLGDRPPLVREGDEGPPRDVTRDRRQQAARDARDARDATVESEQQRGAQADERATLERANPIERNVHRRARSATEVPRGVRRTITPDGLKRGAAAGARCADVKHRLQHVSPGPSCGRRDARARALLCEAECRPSGFRSISRSAPRTSSPRRCVSRGPSGRACWCCTRARRRAGSR